MAETLTSSTVSQSTVSTTYFSATTTTYTTNSGFGRLGELLNPISSTGEIILTAVNNVIKTSVVNAIYKIDDALAGQIVKIANYSLIDCRVKTNTATYDLAPNVVVYPFVYISNSWVLSNSDTVTTNAYVLTQKKKFIGTGYIGTTRQGTSVSSSSDGFTIAVGAPYNNSYVGGAYILIRNTDETWSQQGDIIVGSPSATTNRQGSGVALSADGNTLIITSQVTPSTGYAWVFTRSSTAWTQQGAVLTLTGASVGYNTPMTTSISSNGNTAAIGMYNDNGGVGAVFIFVRSGSTWSQQGSKLTPTGATGNSNFGRSVALSANGDTLVVGAPANNSNVGACFVFTRSGSTWTQYSTVIVGGSYGAITSQGISVGISHNGTTIAMGSYGAVWTFILSGATWTAQGVLLQPDDAEPTAVDALFGSNARLSADGNTLAIGGSQDNDEIGAIWIFKRTSGVWSQKGDKIIPTGNIGSSFFGNWMDLSKDGGTLIVGSPYDDSDVGATYVFN